MIAEQVRQLATAVQGVFPAAKVSTLVVGEKDDEQGIYCDILFDDDETELARTNERNRKVVGSVQYLLYFICWNVEQVDAVLSNIVNIEIGQNFYVQRVRFENSNIVNVITAVEVQVGFRNIILPFTE